MQIIENPWRGKGLGLPDVPPPSIRAQSAEALIRDWLSADETPLVPVRDLGPPLWVKDERTRMGLGSFKAFGAAYVIACLAADRDAPDRATALVGETFVTASAGNHGLSVAAGAAKFGARAVIYLSDTVPEGFAQRLRGIGAEVVRAGAEYEASMAAAAQAADDNGWTLLSDSSWPGYFELPHRLMEGYLVMAAEITRQIPEIPTHIFLQAGVGGLAGACAAWFREAWGEAPRIIVVEPAFAPALMESIKAGRAVISTGPVSNMGRLDCKEPSLIALQGLARDADHFMTITEDEASAILPDLVARDLATTESGGAGLAACRLMDLPDEARVLCILSEEAEG